MAFSVQKDFINTRFVADAEIRKEKGKIKTICIYKLVFGIVCHHFYCLGLTYGS